MIYPGRLHIPQEQGQSSPLFAVGQREIAFRLDVLDFAALPCFRESSITVVEGAVLEKSR